MRWDFHLKRLWIISLALLIGLTGLPATFAAQPASHAKKPAPAAKGSQNKTPTGKPFVIQETYRETQPAEDEKGIVGLDMLIEHNHYPLVQRIFKGTPAYTQGVRVGDTILAINGVRAIDKSLWQIDALISDVPGDTVTLTLLRDGKPHKISLTVMSLAEANATVRNSFAGIIP